MHEEERTPDEVEDVDHEEGDYWKCKLVVLEGQLALSVQGLTHAVEGKGQKDPEKEKKHE